MCSFLASLHSFEKKRTVNFYSRFSHEQASHLDGLYRYILWPAEIRKAIAFFGDAISRGQIKARKLLTYDLLQVTLILADGNRIIKNS